MAEYPQLLHTAVDTTDARALAEYLSDLREHFTGDRTGDRLCRLARRADA